jgi:hypothetical protein
MTQYPIFFTIDTSAIISNTLYVNKQWSQHEEFNSKCSLNTTSIKYTLKLLFYGNEIINYTILVLKTIIIILHIGKR